MNSPENTIFIFFAIVLSICFYLLGFGRGWLHGQGSCPKAAEPVTDTETTPDAEPKKKNIDKCERRFTPNMPPAEIRMRLKAIGLSMSDIDREAGMASGSTSECVRGAGRYQKSRETIAKKLGLKVNDIFPEQPTLPPLSIKKCRELAALRQAFKQMGHTSRTVAKATGLAYDRVSAMLNGSQYYPSMATKIEATFGISIPDTRRKKRAKAS